MDLRGLKKEVGSLAKTKDSLGKFQENWIKTMKNTTNLHLPFLHELPLEKIKEINSQLATLRGPLKHIRQGIEIQEKMQLYCHYLIELKLAQIRDHQSKQNSIITNVLQDESLRLSTTISQIQKFHESVNHLTRQYNKINKTITRSITLEEAQEFQNYPHKEHLGSLRGIAKKQKGLMEEISNNFAALIKSK